MPHCLACLGGLPTGGEVARDDLCLPACSGLSAGGGGGGGMGVPAMPADLLVTEDGGCSGANLCQRGEY